MRTLLVLFSVKDAALLPESLCREHFPLRLERSRRFFHQEDALRCLGAGFLLQRVLKIEESELAAEKNGRLYLPGDTRRFSLSHSGDYIVLAVDDAEIGVDVEKQNPSHLRIAERVLFPEEFQWMQADPTERFFQLWTLKESVMKLHGEGLSLSPAGFSVLELAQKGQMERNKERLWSQSMILGQHSLSFCALHPLDEVKRLTLHPDGSLCEAEW